MEISLDKNKVGLTRIFKELIPSEYGKFSLWNIFVGTLCFMDGGVIVWILELKRFVIFVYNYNHMYEFSLAHFDYHAYLSGYKAVNEWGGNWMHAYMRASEVEINLH